MPITTHDPAPQTDLAAPADGNPWSMGGMDRRGWMVLGAIALFGAVMGAAIGADLHRAPLIPKVLMAAMAISLARAGWGWMRRSGRRERLRAGVLAQVEEYGGGLYGTGGAMTMLVLSAATLQRDWAKAAGAYDFVRGLTMEWFWGFSIESLRNGIWSLMWPLHWYREQGMMAVLAVAAVAWIGSAVVGAWRVRADAERAAVEGA